MAIKQTIKAGDTVLVTGASAGIGRAFSVACADRGARVLLCARGVDRLKSLAVDIRSRVGALPPLLLPYDLASEESRQALLRELRAKGIAVDHLIANAGFGTHGPFAEAEAHSQEAMVRLNVEAVVALAHALLPPMLERGRGGILTLASIAAFQGTPKFATYAATKAFVLSWTEAVAAETRGSGVRIMALCPGPVPTSFQERARMEIPPRQAVALLSAEEVVQRAMRVYNHGQQTLYIPGFTNRMGTTLSHVLPRAWSTRMAEFFMKERS